MERREFIKMAAAVPFAGKAGAEVELVKPTFEQFLRRSVVSREDLDRFLHGPSSQQFDPVLGYVLQNYMPHDGIDGSSTISTVQANGARTSFMYKEKACRINTYGNSMTLCQQVSDGETWQEYLAAHLGEPIRNFGMGGHGVYQAYRRMLREEQSDHGAEYLILYIWGDDHIRSLLRCRHTISSAAWGKGARLFHGNFWAHLEMDLDTGRMVEKENPLPTPSALYRMTDPQFMYDSQRDDLATELYAYKLGLIRDLDMERMSKLAAWLKCPLDQGDESVRVRQASVLLDKYSFRASQFVLEKAREFSRQHDKKLLIVLFDHVLVLPDMQKGGTRNDQEFVDYLNGEKFDYFDLNEVHIRNFKNYSISFDDYVNLYFYGHANPRGNHFFAYSMKDTVVKWLDPKPITYAKPNQVFDTQPGLTTRP